MQFKLVFKGARQLCFKGVFPSGDLLHEHSVCYISKGYHSIYVDNTYYS